MSGRAGRVQSKSRSKERFNNPFILVQAQPIAEQG